MGLSLIELISLFAVVNLVVWSRWCYLWCVSRFKLSVQMLMQLHKRISHWVTVGFNGSVTIRSAMHIAMLTWSQATGGGWWKFQILWQSNIFFLARAGKDTAGGWMKLICPYFILLTTYRLHSHYSQSTSFSLLQCQKHKRPSFITKVLFSSERQWLPTCPSVELVPRIKVALETDQFHSKLTERNNKIKALITWPFSHVVHLIKHGCVVFSMLAKNERLLQI